MSRCWSLTAIGAAAAVCAILCVTPRLQAGNTVVGAVGGIAIDATGVVRMPTDNMKSQRLTALRKLIRRPEGDVNTPVPLRRVSLKRLEAAIRQAMASGQFPLSEEFQYLAGLQRIQYVFVYPEQQDIVIAGPAEGWIVNDRAEIVGATTGRPVLRLDDLLVALRTVQEARRVGISCSIDPTPAGRQQLQALLDRQPPISNPRQLLALEPAMRKAFGPQQISLSGIPSSSHFARVLVSADYHMKRLAMNLDPAPIRDMPSYVQMIKNGGGTADNPRWWLACNYEPLAASDDQLAWELRGQGVKAMTEDEFVAEDGTVRGTGRSSNAAQKWADRMTEKYDQLSQHNAIFGELRNLMDMCVVAALIETHDLRGLAGCELPLLYEAKSPLTIDVWQTPKEVDPQCSFLHTNKGWIVTASGGVQIESWHAAARSQSDATLGKLRQQAAANENWWWN